MLFDNASSLFADLSKLRQRDPNDRLDDVDAQFHDYHDPEVNRLFASSPPAPDEMVSYNFERESKKKESVRELKLESSPSEDEQDDAPLIEEPDLPPIPEETTRLEALIIRKQGFLPPQRDSAAPPPSLLSLQMRDEHKQKEDAKKIASVAPNRKGITVYAPDRSPLQVFVEPSDSVAIVIKKALAAHESSMAKPPLLYNFPDGYDLRLHEGDGEPDEDFPALDRKRLLKQFGNMNEFCLCRNSESIKKVASPPINNNTAPVSAPLSINTLATAASSFFGPRPESSRGSMGPPLPRPSAAETAEGAPSSSDPVGPNVVEILLPHSNSFKIQFEGSTTANDLLLMLAKKPRMRMLRDEYVLHLQSQDQTRLQYVQPVLSPDDLISKLGVQKLELRRRYFADDPESKSCSRTEDASTDDFFFGKSGKKSDNKSRETILYTDVTAAVYQEWTVLKKNKFGRIQERILGIDSSKIYNYETETRNSANVKHAQRSIASVKKVEYLPGGDDRSFRILFAEEGKDPYEIEYQCLNAKNCVEIISKINYLLAARDSTAKR